MCSLRAISQNIDDHDLDTVAQYREKPTLVFPSERRRLSGFAHGQTLVAREKRVAFPSPQNKLLAALLRMCNASPFPSIIHYDLVNVSLHRQIIALGFHQRPD
jgi:hypothetical protein